MRLAPDAEMDDGQLVAIAVPELPRRSLLRRLPSLYSGRYLTIPGVKKQTGQRLSGEALEGAEVPLEFDGEVLGRLPVEIRLIPRALRVLSPA